MSYDIKTIYKYTYLYGKVHGKKQFDEFTAEFKKNCMTDIKLFFDQIDGGKTPEAASAEFVASVVEAYGTKGKLKGSELMALNTYTIYYVFPTILSEREDDGQMICEALRDAWNSATGCKIQFADYDTIRDGFQLKIFGIPVGEK